MKWFVTSSDKLGTWWKTVNIFLGLLDQTQILSWETVSFFRTMYKILFYFLQSVLNKYIHKYKEYLKKSMHCGHWKIYFIVLTFSHVFLGICINVFIFKKTHFWKVCVSRDIYINKLKSNVWKPRLLFWCCFSVPHLPSTPFFLNSHRK